MHNSGSMLPSHGTVMPFIRQRKSGPYGTCCRPMRKEAACAKMPGTPRRSGFLSHINPAFEDVEHVRHMSTIYDSA